MITDAGYAGRLEATLKLHIVYTPKTGYILDVLHKNARGLSGSLFQVSGDTLPHAFN